MSTKLQVLEQLYKAGDDGLTDYDIQESIPRIHPSTLRGCRKSMERAGFCVAIDGLATTASGYSAKVHILTIKGTAEFQKTFNYGV
jgi:hypothetical protein